jgi:hypothetical protein
MAPKGLDRAYFEEDLGQGAFNRSSNLAMDRGGEFANELILVLETLMGEGPLV